MQRDVEKLRRWCIRRKLQGWKIAEVCRHARISRTSFYRYWNRYEKHGFDGLKTRSRRPHTIHRKDDAIVQKVLEIRIQEQYCPQRIAGILKRQGLTIGHMTVYRILCRYGLNKPLSQPRVKRKYRSFQKDHPNEMWQQIDLKIVNSKWMVSILDDHSRYILASAITRHATARSIIDLVRQQAIKLLYGKPEQILTDHGRQFYNPYSESDFDRFCKKQSIEHMMGGIGKPTTLGKIERWHHTYDVERARFGRHEEFINYYNQRRVHMSLGYRTPAQAYWSVTYLVG